MERKHWQYVIYTKDWYYNKEHLQSNKENMRFNSKMGKKQNQQTIHRKRNGQTEDFVTSSNNNDNDNS